jgi:hypothetical protein
MDPMATPIPKPAQLLDIHMDQLAGVGSFIAADHPPVGRSIQASRLSPWRHSTR